MTGMEMQINVRYTVQLRALFGRVPQGAVLQALASEGELLPLHVADIAERFELQFDDPFVLRSRELGSVAVVPMTPSPYARTAGPVPGASATTAAHVLYLDSEGWADGKYDLVVVTRAAAAQLSRYGQPPTRDELEAYMTSEVTVCDDES